MTTPTPRADAARPALHFTGRADMEASAAACECGGVGWITVPVCCGRSHWSCCGEPDPEQAECPSCYPLLRAIDTGATP